MKSQILLSALGFVLVTSAFAKAPERCQQVVDQVLKERGFGTRKNPAGCVGKIEDDYYTLGDSTVSIKGSERTAKGATPFQIQSTAASPLKGINDGLLATIDLDSGCNIMRVTYARNDGKDKGSSVTPETCKSVASALKEIEQADAELRRADGVPHKIQAAKHNQAVAWEAADKKFGKTNTVLCGKMAELQKAQTTIASPVGGSSTKANTTVDYDSPAMNMGEAR